MPFIEAIGARPNRHGAVSLECRVGAGTREVFFEVFDDVRHNAINLVVSATELSAQWRAAPETVSSERSEWGFSISRLTLEQAAHSVRRGVPDMGILFWELMRREFHPYSPTLIQAAVMRAYVMLWQRMFHSTPTVGVERDLNQLGIFDVRIFAGVAFMAGWDPGTNDTSIHSLREEAHAVVLERILANEMSGRQIAKDTGEEPVKALAAPSSKLPVYRPR
jgi:hypothetical protein